MNFKANLQPYYENICTLRRL